MHRDLVELLEDAWFQTGYGKSTINFLEVYGIYERHDEQPRNEVTSRYASNLSMQRIALSKPPPDPVLQTLGKGPGDRGPPVGGGLDTGGGGYIWFATPRFEESASRERVVLHVHPYERVLTTWDVLAREVMKAQGRFSGVNSGKFMKLECYQDHRHDTIIIYTKDKTTRDEVLREVKRLIAVGTFQQGQFKSPLPRGLKEESAGIGFGSEPPNIQLLDSYKSKPSYGKYLGQAVSIAISIAVAAGLDMWPDFKRLAAYVLIMVGYDIAEPNNIYEMSPPLAGSIPWHEPLSGTTADMLRGEYRNTPLYKAIQKELILK